MPNLKRAVILTMAAVLAGARLAPEWVDLANSDLPVPGSQSESVALDDHGGDPKTLNELV